MLWCYSVEQWNVLYDSPPFEFYICDVMWCFDGRTSCDLDICIQISLNVEWNSTKVWNIGIFQKRSYHLVTLKFTKELRCLIMVAASFHVNGVLTANKKTILISGSFNVIDIKRRYNDNLFRYIHIVTLRFTTSCI